MTNWFFYSFLNLSSITNQKYNKLTGVHFKLNVFIHQIFYEKLLLKRDEKPRSAKKQQLKAGKEQSETKELVYFHEEKNSTLLSNNNNFYTMSSYALKRMLAIYM